MILLYVDVLMYSSKLTNKMNYWAHLPYPDKMYKLSLVINNNKTVLYIIEEFVNLFITQ